MFLKVPNTSIKVEVVVEKKVNRGGGYSLKIPVAHRFNGPEKLVKKKTHKENRSRPKRA